MFDIYRKTRTPFAVLSDKVEGKRDRLPIPKKSKSSDDTYYQVRERMTGGVR